MALNKRQKKVVQIVGLLAIISLILTSFAPAIAVLVQQ
jgi:hypothetical protein